MTRRRTGSPSRSWGLAIGNLSWGRLAAGGIVGCLVGAALYWASHLRGLGLFLLVGAAAGGAAAVFLRVYGGSIDLSEVKLAIPNFSELNFVVAPDNRLVAWRIFVEMVTRVSTQPLPDDAGDLREALTSLYLLFQSVRENLREARPSPRRDAATVEELGVALLNLELRPFLSRWHVALKEWEDNHQGESESAWERNLECRAELRELQQRLGYYVDGFAKLAGTVPLIPESE
ncbi:conserved hypothetical protein [Frankia sp. Hr75.2]|nr:conserved hypothetical protein [Frankia sp. Hr75.2]